MNGRETLERRGEDRRDAEIARLKREVEMLRERERAARTEAEDARRHFSELTAMSKRFASSMRAGTGERQQYRRRLAAQFAVSRVLAEARDLDEAAPKVFEVLGERLGWQLGVLWTLDRQAGVLRRAGIWRSSEASPGAMEEACEDMSLRRGESLPGRVWEREEPVWVEDVLEDAAFLRNGAAAGDGLRGAFAFPIKEGGFVGVFELFRREVLPPDEDLLRTAGLIGDQIGQFLERRRAEEERDLSLARERAARREASDILESINDAFFALDHERRFTYVNRKAEQFWGRTRGELLGKNIWEEFPQAVGSENYQRVEKALREGEAVEFEAVSPILHAWISGRVYPSPEGASVLFHSIEERKRADEAIRESEERYRSLAEATSSIVWIGAGDGTCAEEMPAWEAFTGQTFEEYRGFGWLDAVHPEDRPPQNAWEELATKPAPTEVEYRIRRHDGEYRRVVSRGVPIFDESGGVREYIGTINDVEDHRRAEEALRESEERLRTVVNNVPLALFALDREGVFTLLRGRGLEALGLEQNQLVGRSVFEVYADHTGMLEDVRRALSGEMFTAITEVGDLIFETGYAPIRGRSGETVSVIGVATNITERKRIEAERNRFLATEWRARAEAEERKRISRELHDRVAHSMGVVHQSLELYEAFKERNPEQAEARMRLARETTREALDLTRNLSRELHDTEARNGLSAALSNLLKTAVPPGLKSSIRVEGDESLVPPRVREQLFLILREAVRNAVSHAGAERLKVGVEARPEKVVGYVEDDGRGFEGASEGDGSGRGIDSMRERAELVDGAFRLSSVPGTGTKIEASIPLNAGRIEGGRRKL